MAKKPQPAAVEAPPKRPPGRPPTGRRKPDSSVILLCNWEWKNALADLARQERMSLSEYLERAVNVLASKQGHAPMPPRIST